MPTLTYFKIGATTISGSSTNSVTFNSISGYTDLVLVVSGKSSSAGDALVLRFNGDSGSNYSRTYGYGTGSGYGQGKQGSQNAIYSTLTNTTPTQTVHHINSYLGSTYKNVLLRNDSQTNAMVFTAGTWQSTAAITSVTVSLTGNFVAGSTVALYGIL